MLPRGIALACALLAAGTLGCSDHGSMRGTVVMKVDPTTAHICLDDGEVAVNDPVSLYKNVCRPIGRGSLCEQVFVAEGTVIELIDEHYSVVRFPAGTNFEEGDGVKELR